MKITGTSNLALILMQRDMFCTQISQISQIYPLAPCPFLLPAPCSLPLINQTVRNLSHYVPFS